MKAPSPRNVLAQYIGRFYLRRSPSILIANSASDSPIPQAIRVATNSEGKESPVSIRRIISRDTPEASASAYRLSPRASRTFLTRLGSRPQNFIA